ncbi:MAG: hypothetical protein ACRD3P_06855 [Terriglobales bacterium]
MTRTGIRDKAVSLLDSSPPSIRPHSAASIWLLLLLFAFSWVVISATEAAAADSDWIRPENADTPLIWGRKDGILFGLPSEGGLPGPRGLIRVGVMSPETNRPQLLNFIAVEPVVVGAGIRFSRMAFSELEFSTLDPGQRGKRLWVEPASDYRGTLTTIKSSPSPIKQLEVRINVERFTANGAHVYVVASIESDHPGELKLRVYMENDSPAIEELTLTATMGNFERLRWLFLKDRTVESLQLFGSETGDGFFEHENYPVEEMLRSADGDAIALAASNEPNPSSELNVRSKFWHYPLPRLTQYWRVPAHDIEPDLRVRVNARQVYWASHFPVPNGVAFENFELRQRYVAGQTFVFGATTTEPWDFNPPIPHLRRVDVSGRRSNQESEKH